MKKGEKYPYYRPGVPVEQDQMRAANELPALVAGMYEEMDAE